MFCNTCESLETSNILSVVLVFDPASFSLGISFNLQISSGLFLWVSTLLRRGGSCRRPHHRQKSFCRRPHHRQEGFCRTTGKKVFAAPQARRFLPHLRQEGFCRTSGKRAFAAPQTRWFCCLTTNKQYILAAPDKSISPSHR